MRMKFYIFLIGKCLSDNNDVTQTSEQAKDQADTWHSNNFMYNYPMYTGQRTFTL